MKALGNKNHVFLAIIFLGVAAVGFVALAAIDRLLGGWSKFAVALVSVALKVPAAQSNGRLLQKIRLSFPRHARKCSSDGR